MKRTFLLLLHLGLVLSTIAQEKSVIFVNQPPPFKKDKGPWTQDLKSYKWAQSAPVTANEASSASKATSWESGEWFCFPDAASSAGIAQYATWPVYPDSNITTGNFNWYLHGFGTSFDPKSPMFGADSFANLQPVFPTPTFDVTATDAYKVDSIQIAGWYQRVDNTVTDTLNIYLAYATYPAGSTPGIYNIRWSFTIPVDTLWGRTDSAIQIVQPTYDYINNSFNSDTIPNLIKITKILNDEAFADSVLHPTSGGSYLHVWNFAVPGGLQVPAGGHVVAFATFGSAVTHPLGTNWNNVNMWQQWTAAVNGSNGIPNQFVNDFNGGLGAFTDERYHIGNFWQLSNTTIGQHNTLAPAYTYTPVFMSDPWFAFHLISPTSVKEVNGTAVSDINAYPNPANTEVSIAFTPAGSGKAAVSITNAIGQVICTQEQDVNANKINRVTFPTAALADGIYFYTVEINRQRHTSRFLVAH